MAKNQNTYEKLRREMDKKRKAEEKRERRRRRKEAADAPPDAEVRAEDDGPEPD